MSLRGSPRTPTTCSGAIHTGEPIALRNSSASKSGIVAVIAQARSRAARRRQCHPCRGESSRWPVSGPDAPRSADAGWRHWRPLHPGGRWSPHPAGCASREQRRASAATAGPSMYSITRWGTGSGRPPPRSAAHAARQRLQDLRLDLEADDVLGAVAGRHAWHLHRHPESGIGRAVGVLN